MRNDRPRPRCPHCGTRLRDLARPEGDGNAVRRPEPTGVLICPHGCLVTEEERAALELDLRAYLGLPAEGPIGEPGVELVATPAEPAEQG